MWTTGGKPFAGIFRLGPDLKSMGVPPNWMPYVETEDVDKTAQLATTLGGTVVNGPTDIPGTGRFAVVQDPQGAVFGIYKPTGPSVAWDGNPVVGRFSWHELMTTDWKAAFEFYKKLFAWDNLGEMDMGGGNMYAMFGLGKMFGGIFNRFGDMASMRPFWLCYIHVKDVGKAADTATKAGASLKRPRMDIPGGTIAILGDPQGAGFALHDLMEGAATPKSAATPTAKKAAVKTPAKSPAKPKAKTAPAKRVGSKKTAAKKTSTKRSSAKSSAKKSSAKKSSAKKSSANKSSSKKSAKRSAKRRSR
jgi:predicted enzyme related to lactoylglutathione lyase